jgi:hypothetical protein
VKLASRLDRLEGTAARQDCPANHYAVHIARVDIDGVEMADPEPCTACGSAPEVQRIVITTVPDRGECP